MYEIDFLPVGDGDRSGDAIALRYTHPDTGKLVVGILDAGFEDDGDALVAHVNTYYGTDTIDFFLSTHPDADHINGAGKVMRGLRVGTLMIHRPAQHGFPGNSGAEPAEELVALALAQGSEVVEPFAGVQGFGESLYIAGPTSSTGLDKERIGQGVSPSPGQGSHARGDRTIARQFVRLRLQRRDIAAQLARPSALRPPSRSSPTPWVVVAP